MKCLRCLNEDPALFFHTDQGWMCRKCLDFGPLPQGQLPVKPSLSVCRKKAVPHLEFALTDFQRACSKQALCALKQGKDVFVYAAAGAGKTEMTLESIAWFLNHHKKVCFAISRRQVVLEIAQRLAQNFPNLKVVPVCQGFTLDTDGDIIVCTTHQLYRYPFCFDLLIMDEIDAFPFAGNEVLENIAAQSCRGVKLLLSATPDESHMKAIEEGKMELVSLFERPHGHPLCVPKEVRLPKLLLPLAAAWWVRNLKKDGKQVLLFVPRIKDCRWMKAWISLFARCDAIHSKTKNKDEILDDFRKKKKEVLICTTLLERGITIPSVQVLVYRGDHPVFSTASLIQIFGRVGRTFSDPDGMSVALCMKPSAALKGCVSIIRQMNSHVCTVRKSSPDVKA